MLTKPLSILLSILAVPRELLARSGRTLLKSHLIRSERGFIEHSSRGMWAWYSEHNIQTGASTLRSLVFFCIKTSFIFRPMRFSIFSCFCSFFLIFHILLFSRWTNFNSYFFYLLSKPTRNNYYLFCNVSTFRAQTKIILNDR